MVDALPLFPKLNQALIELLGELTPAQWNAATVCKGWTVKDIAAHLLDTAMRRLSAGRDGHFGAGPATTDDQGLLQYINSLNADWVAAYRRVSPRLLIRQLEQIHDEYYAHLSSTDPMSPALYPVSWAGEEQSEHWFDVAREYTERWHHQQQIRLATGTSSIVTPEFYPPFLATCMRALPFHLREIGASDETVLKIQVVGDAGGLWTLKCRFGQWQFAEADTDADTTVYVDQNIAWLLFSRGIGLQEAQQYWQVLGDRQLGLHALKLKPFMI